MEAMFRSIFTFIVTGADTLTMTMMMLNNLARGGVERTVVVEKKALAAAALSELDSINTFAERLKEISDVSDGISPEQFDKARQYLDNYALKRKAEMIGVPLVMRKAAAKKPNSRKAPVKKSDSK
jgi:hypothetical protein